LLLRRCPGIARHLPLNAIASFLCVTPQQLSRIRGAMGSGASVPSNIFGLSQKIFSFP
jgi:hypothetical protein